MTIVETVEGKQPDIYDPQQGGYGYARSAVVFTEPAPEVRADLRVNVPDEFRAGADYEAPAQLDIFAHVKAPVSHPDEPVTIELRVNGEAIASVSETAWNSLCAVVYDRCAQAKKQAVLYSAALERNQDSEVHQEV